MENWYYKMMKFFYLGMEWYGMMRLVYSYTADNDAIVLLQQLTLDYSLYSSGAVPVQQTMKKYCIKKEN
eukprot:scaffold5486_cov282-Ochromonas_danica.AAC.3